MMRWLRKYFIPHEGNEYKPHFLRREAIFGILAFVLILEGAFLTQAVILGRGSGFLALVLPNTLVDETNQQRLASNLAPLAENPILTAAAQQKANDMAAKGYFSHTSPEGLTPWYWFKKVGYAYTYAGENLAVNFSDSNDVTNAWMKSPAHRANILNSSYTQIGIATAPGNYQGAQTVYVVQLFARPSAPTPAPAVAIATPTPTPRPAPVPAPQPAPEPVVPPQQNFVVVEGASETTPSSTEPQEEEPQEEESQEDPTAGIMEDTIPAAPVAGTTQTAMEPRSNLVQRMFAAPRLTVNVIYIALALIILIAMILNVFTKVSVQHPQLVLNGIVVLLTLGTMAVFNHQLLLANAQIF
jgi:hypothetical protein